MQDESDADARLVAEAKNLQSRMSDESAADATMIAAPSECMRQHLTQMKSETASFPMSQRLIQLTSETASFWLLPPILHQHLIHPATFPSFCVSI